MNIEDGVDKEDSKHKQFFNVSCDKVETLFHEIVALHALCIRIYAYFLLNDCWKMLKIKNIFSVIKTKVISYCFWNHATQAYIIGARVSGKIGLSFFQRFLRISKYVLYSTLLY